MAQPKWITAAEGLIEFLNEQTYESFPGFDNWATFGYLPTFDDRALDTAQVILGPAINRPNIMTRGGREQYTVDLTPKVRGSRTETASTIVVGCQVVRRVASQSEITDMAWLTQEVIDHAWKYRGEMKVVSPIEWDQLFDLEIYEKHKAFWATVLISMR